MSQFRIVLRHSHIIATLILLGGAWLRLNRMTAKSLWFDEIFAVFIASKPLGQLFVNIRIEPHPPLHYLLVHWWVALAGDGEAALRLTSVLVSALVILAVWLFGRRLIGEAPALLAALVVAISPSQVASGQEVRMYALLTLTSVLSWWALWAAFSKPSRVTWALYAVTTVAMVYTHYYGFFALAGQAIFATAARGTSRPAFRTWLGVSLGTLAAYLPWWQVFFDQLLSEGGQVRRPPASFGLFVDTLSVMSTGLGFLRTLLFEPPDRANWTLQFPHVPWLAVAALAGIALLVGAAIRSPRYSWEAKCLLLIAGCGVPTIAFVASLLVPVFAPRYLIFVGPYLALLGAAGTGALLTRSAQGKALASAATALVLAANLTALFAYYRQPRLDSFNWRQIGRELELRSEVGETIACLPWFLCIPANYYVRRPQAWLQLAPYGNDDVVAANGWHLAQIVESVVGQQRILVLTLWNDAPPLNALIAGLEGQSFIVAQRDRINGVAVISLQK